MEIQHANQEHSRNTIPINEPIPLRSKTITMSSLMEDQILKACNRLLNLCSIPR